MCYATRILQDAVRVMAPDCDLVLVVGSTNSSNSNRLREVAERQGAVAYLIDDPGMIDPAWLAGARRIGVTAGDSAPETLVRQVLDHLKALGADSVRNPAGVEAHGAYHLPKELVLKLPQ